jgi:ketosteroid isomerase-like protein
MWKHRGALSWLTMLLLLGSAHLIQAQTTGDQARQLSDKQIGEAFAAADSYTVDAVNRHDAYAVAAVYWDDAIDISPLGVTSSRPAIERRLAEQFKSLDVRDFSETIDEIHISGDHGWFVGHWSDTYVAQPGGERRSRKGYITCVLERRNGEWKARMHATFLSGAQ